MLKNLQKNGYTFQFMKFLLIFTLFLSFAGCPSLLAVIDDHHSVGFENEHGVPHLILFHAHNTNEDSSSKILTTATKEGNHEFHLSSSSALLKKAGSGFFYCEEYAGRK